MTFSYNPRKLFTQIAFTAYQYFSEQSGRITYAQNLNDATLDRSYDYDHVGRLIVSTTGSNARHHTGQGGTPQHEGPYSQIYGYDVWGNALRWRAGVAWVAPRLWATRITSGTASLTTRRAI